MHKLLSFTLLLLLLPLWCTAESIGDVTPRRGQGEFEFSTGYGENHRFPAATRVRFGMDLMRLRFARFTSPRTQTAVEFSAGKQTRDMDSIALSGLYSYRRYCAKSGRSDLGYSFGTGLMYFAQEVSGLGTKTNFTEQIGLVWKYATGNDSAVTMEYRFCHVSNAGIKLPNVGINASILTIGHSWLR